jgi:hypothetical protein
VGYFFATNILLLHSRRRANLKEMISCKKVLLGSLFFASEFKFIAFASTAGRLRNRSAATFSPLKKFASHFFNYAFGVTGEKEAANPVTGKK